jgi:protein CMS1
MAEKPEKVAKVSTKKGDKKRKRQEGDESSTRESASKPEANVASESADGPSRKKSKNKKKKEGDSKSSELEVKKTSPADGIDESIGTKDGRLVADYLMQKAKKHNKDLTAMELSDMIVPGEEHRLVQSPNDVY